MQNVKASIMKVKRLVKPIGMHEKDVGVSLEKSVLSCECRRRLGDPTALGFWKRLGKKVE